MPLLFHAGQELDEGGATDRAKNIVTKLINACFPLHAAGPLDPFDKIHTTRIALQHIVCNLESLPDVFQHHPLPHGLGG